MNRLHNWRTRALCKLHEPKGRCIPAGRSLVRVKDRKEVQLHTSRLTLRKYRIITFAGRAEPPSMDRCLPPRQAASVGPRQRAAHHSPGSSKSETKCMTSFWDAGFDIFIKDRIVSHPSNKRAYLFLMCCNFVHSKTIKCFSSPKPC